MTGPAGAALTGLLTVLLTLIPGAAPAWARSPAGTPSPQGSPDGSPQGGSPPAFPAPTGLTARTVSSSEIDLSWTSVRGAAGYDVFDSTDQGQEGNSDPQFVQGITYQVKGLASCQTYYFEVAADDGNGNWGDYSSEMSAPTDCPQGSPPALAGDTGSSGGSVNPAAIIVPIALIGIPGALIARQRRKRRRRAHQAEPASSVQAVAHAGPPGVVGIRVTGKGATHTVRVEPSPGPSITTIEEVPPR
jgi:hypothetical protein